MTRKLLLLFAALLLSAIDIHALDFTSGYLKYRVTDAEQKLVTVSGHTDELPTVAEIPATVSYEGIDYAVNAVGDNAFWGCSTLEKIIIEKGVQSIGELAFYNCSILTQVTIPNSVTIIGAGAFEYCYLLEQISIPASVSTIGNYAFSGCDTLEQITIPDSVTTIGDYAFSDCYALKAINVIEGNQYYCSVDGILFSKDQTLLLQYPSGRPEAEYKIPENVISIGNGAFFRCSELTQIIIPSSVTAIGDGAFSGCSALTQIIIPSRVTVIGDKAFSGCSALTQISIPSSVTTIGDEAFSGCSVLAQIIIPASISVIGYKTFFDCEALEQITIPDSVTTIGDFAFSDCEALEQVFIPSSVITMGIGVFTSCSALKEINVAENNQNYCSVDGILFSKDQTQFLQYPVGRLDTAFEIPASVTTIGEYAFAYTSALSQITIPFRVITISNYAFAWCTSLDQITIPDNVVSIGRYAFSSCSAIEQITVGNNMQSISAGAFSYCPMLKKITSRSLTPPTLERGYPFPFNGVDNSIPVVVPGGSLEAYKASDWNYFTNLQEDINGSVQQPTLAEGVRYADGQLLNPQQLLVSVYDLTGRLVYRGNDSARAFPGGVYIVSYGRTTEKMVF